MRNLKRALSLALATIMVLSLMVVGAGAVSIGDFSDGEKIVNKEAVTVLTTLGVINGKDDGSYDPQGIVTRAEMAKMICVILNGGKDPQLGEAVKNSYTDTVGHWAAPYIEYCTTLGIVSGRGNGTFDPNGTVSVAEAGKMLLVALGYNAGIEGYTGANWQINTDVRANQKGLYNGLDTLNTNVALTRDNAAQMCYNALDVRMVEYNYVITGNSDNSISTKPQLNDNKLKTLLEEKFNAVKVEGTVIGNQDALLTSNVTDKEKDTKGGVIGSSLDANKTRIDITNGDDQSAYKGIENFNVASDLNVLGRSVYLYVKIASSASKADVIGSVIVGVDNKEVKDYSSDSIKSVADDNNLNIVSTTKVVENYAGQAVLSSDLAKKAGTTGVEKILIDANNDGDLDYVLLNTVEMGKVTKYSTNSDGSITVARANGKSFTADNKDKVVGFDNVERDDVVLASYIGGKLHVDKAESITGTVEAYKLKDVTKDDYVGTPKGTYTGNLTVDGTNYTVSFAPTYTDSADFFAATDPADKGIINSEATFYLDAQGYIVARTEVDEAAYQYAYVWGAEAGGSIATDRVKVTLDDGTTKTYDLDSKSDIDVTTAKTDADKGLINENDMQGLIFAYTLSKSGEIKLMQPKGGAVMGSNPDHTKGMTGVTTTDGSGKAVKADVNNILTAYALRDGNDKNGETPKTTSTFYANNSTVFFYVTKLANGNIDKVTVYIGRNNAPSVDGKKGEALMALNSKYDIGAAAMTNTSAKEEAGDHLFVYANNYVHNDYVQVGAILNGETEGKDIQVSKYEGSDVTNNTVVKDGLYLFSKDGDQYELTSPADSTFYQTGYVVRTPIKNTIVLDKTENGTGALGEYAITKNSVIIDNTTGPNPAEGILGGAINKGDQVWLLFNKDNEILMAYFVTPDDSTGGTTHATFKPVITSISGTTINMRAYAGDNFSAQDISNIIKDQIADVASVSVSSLGYTVTYANGNIVTYTIHTDLLARVTYGSDNFLAQGDSVKVTEQTAASKLLSYTTSGNTTTYTVVPSYSASTTSGVEGNTYRVGPAVSSTAQDVMLADGYAYTDSSNVVALPSTVVSSSKVVPAGTKLTVTAAANNTVYATVDGVKTAVVSGTSSASMDAIYTMPKAGVTFTVETTPVSGLTVTLAASGGTLANDVYTAKNALDSFNVTVSAVKANQDDTITVTVSPKSPLYQDVNLTLTPTNATLTSATTVKFTAGDGSNTVKQFALKMGAANATLTLSDNTSATYNLTLPAAVTASWSSGANWSAGDASASATTSVPTGAEVTLATTDNAYHKIGNDYVKDGHTFTMVADTNVNADKYHKITTEIAVKTSGAVNTNLGGITVSAAAVPADTYVKEGSTYEVVFTLGGTGVVINNPIKIMMDTVNGVASGSYSAAAELLAVSDTQGTNISSKKDTVTINAADTADVTLSYTLSTT